MNILIKNRKYKYAVEAGNRITSAWKWINLLRHTHITTNKTKTTTNDCGGIMGISKQEGIFAPSCSAVQLGRKDKTMEGCGRSLC